jgi:hypothetical protein
LKKEIGKTADYATYVTNLNGRVSISSTNVVLPFEFGEH